MRGLFEAALLLAPALVTALPTIQADDEPHALIKLDLGRDSEDVRIQETSLELHISESTTPCGNGNVTLNGQFLSQDELGIGSGSITTEQGNIIVANWKFTCVHLADEFQGQLMTFDALYIDSKQLENVGFSVQFQQTAPVSISYIDGAESIISTPKYGWDTSAFPDEEAPVDLESELADLELMKQQLMSLEHAIAVKVQYISETFDFDRPEELLSIRECDSLKCVFKTMYSRVKGMANRIYSDRVGDSDAFAGPPGRPHWPFPHHGKGKHGEHPPFFPPHHGNHTHGNHTHPHPPFHPPPFCHCPPPPHHGHGKRPPPPPGHGHHPPPPPPDHRRPPPPDHGHVPPPPPPPGSGKGHHHHQPPPPPGRHFRHRPHLSIVNVLRIVATIVVLGFLISAVHIRYRSKSRDQRRVGCEGHLQQHRGRGRHSSVKAKYSEIVRWIKEGIRRSNAEDEEKEALMRQIHGGDEEEEDEDNLSTTMEQEISQLRTVADVVTTMVEAEEGRSRQYLMPVRREHHHHQQQQQQQHHEPVPPSPTSAFPDYASSDESLPAYDEADYNPSMVADGFRYTPGTSRYTPSDRSVMGSSLDEHLGRKD
ncbi:hypothetical protein F4778DRAFT_613959 [Xylariomycetidae sp. FL2044]|nr:hypothetical protein F4778DRAFT_613959 [Xylariomycetidae sp. FL2044]